MLRVEAGGKKPPQQILAEKPDYKLKSAKGWIEGQKEQ